MNKQVTEILPQFFNNQYVSLNEFREKLSGGKPSPYHSQFRFSKLMEELKNLNSSDKDFSVEIKALLESVDQDLATGKLDINSLKDHKDFSFLMTFLFPSFFFKGQLGFIGAPFRKGETAFQTKEMIDLMESERGEIRMDLEKLYHASTHDILKAGTMILNEFYDQNINFHFSDIMVIRDKETKMEKHYKFNIVLDYVEIKKLKPLKKLSKKQIHKLLNNLDDEALWLQHIPPENFSFEGLFIGYMTDVTHVEVLSAIKAMMVDETNVNDHNESLNYIESLVRSYLHIPDIHLGSLELGDRPCQDGESWSLLRKHNNEIMIPSLQKDGKGIYAKMIREGKMQMIEDLKQEKEPSLLEQALIEAGFRSLLVSPLYNDNEQLVGLIELGSPVPYKFNELINIQLKDVISLFQMGFNRFLQDTENAIRLTMQQEFTAIHPSVEWKFNEVATKYYWEQVVSDEVVSIEPIVFKGVYPLYGQADIVGSSQLRNDSIQADMVDNLDRLDQLLKACREKVEFHLLDVYQVKGEKVLNRLRQNGFVSSDESLIVDWLTREVHPLIFELKDRFPELPHKMIDAYFEYLDADLNIVYNRRKDYEESVSLLNQTISHFLSQEEEKMQNIMPHFFEKYETDGVEYNLYVGQSILQSGNFSEFFLKDFRLWQLAMMCELSQLIKVKAASFPVPITTAQLIFVYNNALSIRFHIDEKQFDVDGAYNVRYEILKKRIDKAKIKGTNERLTQAGKIAIVWLQEKDKLEYLEYLHHLIHKGLIHEEIEDLELEKMQGVEGLKALRVSVIDA